MFSFSERTICTKFLECRQFDRQPKKRNEVKLAVQAISTEGKKKIRKIKNSKLKASSTIHSRGLFQAKRKQVTWH